IDAEERTERAEAKEALIDTAGNTLAELTAFGVPSPTKNNQEGADMTNSRTVTYRYTSIALDHRSPTRSTAC
ncbi:MAG TPA: hypothetical protein VF317_02810, partial [Dermatophilaceae bacterium]